MPTYLIERNVPGARNLTSEELKGIAQTSNAVVDGLGVPYTWHQSFVAGDKIYCVHEAESADVVYEHARRGGFPADLVVEVPAVIGPQTAEG
ncbi:MAG TPA: DUF4242 domain-containing protein [Jiangellales bacterium]|nr:DUF4242 domain-containing protein [Jiangellales bacterium]